MRGNNHLFKNSLQSPCYNCEFRQINCHADCEQYKAYKEETEKAREERRN